MNRRTLSLLLAGLILVPTSLMSAPVQEKPMEPKCSCKDCKKCGPKCDCKKKCKCKLKCKCKSKCCKAGQSPQDRSPQGRPIHGRPSPNRHSRYKEILSKFDKNKDGKLNEKEREEAKKYFISKYRNHGK